MHNAIVTFAENIKQVYPDVFAGRKILEVGSLNINGSLRSMFAAEDYVGIDANAGPGVDLQVLAHDFAERPNGYFDTAFSTSVLEHDPFHQWTLRRMANLIRVGGHLLITTVGPEFMVHELDCSPHKGFYNSSLSIGGIIGDILTESRFAQIKTYDIPETGDLLLLFYKKIEPRRP